MVKDHLAERQARAAVALVRLGKSDEIIPLLRHSADPRLRSFIVNWLNPLGADPQVIAAALEHIDPGIKPTPVEPAKTMDAILFHPETSMRRALILTLGTYGTEGLSPAERAPLTVKLLDRYRNDPDSGIHGAVAWTLRQWKQQEKVKAVDLDLAKLKDQGVRRWFVNSQGQTFAMIEGPVEFQMGSPPTEPDRIRDNEIPHTRIIPRRFAIAAQEVSVEQYQEFMKQNPGVADISTDRYSPDPKGPMNGPFWYDAAAYCNWLSRKESLPECYEPNPQGEYAAGMKIKSDALRLTGYRLPTEGEWEYACRAGAATSRYYGSSVDLLGRYAWYSGTSQDHAWACGSLLPNELGLFDLLGNVTEWCQDVPKIYRPDNRGQVTDLEASVDALVDETFPRLLRGGSFDSQAAYVRSAYRGRYTPSSRYFNFGFRPSRTYP
jgi:eukaryotic-like serine/threonine-protein kinase